MNPTTSGRFDSGVHLGFKLLESLAGSASQESLFYSPLSIAMCLSLLYTGARGETALALGRVLGCEELTAEEINRAYSLVMEMTGPRGTLPDAEKEKLAEASHVLDITSSIEDEDEIARLLGPDWFVRQRQAIRLFHLTPLPKGFTLSIANGVWVNRGIVLRPEFAEEIRQAFAAEIGELDFTDEGALSTINRWISTATHGLIPHLISELDPRGALVSANTVYFKAYWFHQFRKRHTKEAPFTRLDGQETPCQMMYQEMSFRYLENDAVQLIGLPYDMDDGPLADIPQDTSNPDGPKLSIHMRDNLREHPCTMWIALPRPEVSWEAFLNMVTAQQWAAWIARARSQNGELWLPRFRTEYERDLGDSLITLGMGVAFDPDLADFSGMCISTRSPWISQIVHKAVITVDEEGTEASAATIQLTAGGYSGPPPIRYQMVVDHPFFYTIQEDKSGVVLFMGTVLDPGNQ